MLASHLTIWFSIYIYHEKSSQGFLQNVVKRDGLQLLPLCWFHAKLLRVRLSSSARLFSCAQLSIANIFSLEGNGLQRNATCKQLLHQKHQFDAYARSMFWQCKTAINMLAETFLTFWLVNEWYQQKKHIFSICLYIISIQSLEVYVV